MKSFERANQYKQQIKKPHPKAGLAAVVGFSTFSKSWRARLGLSTTDDR
jgi:hypothetical protein